MYGMVLSTLPPNSRSFYDSFGVSVASCVRYDLGRVCFLAQDFLDVLKDEVSAEERGGGEQRGGAAVRLSVTALGVDCARAWVWCGGMRAASFVREEYICM